MTPIASPRRSVLAAAIVSLTALAAAFTTEAAIITWGSATTVAGDSDVSTTGTLVDAANLGINGQTVVVNGVSFTGWQPTNTTTSGIFSLSGLTVASGNGTNSAPFGNLSTAYKDLLRDSAAALGVVLPGSNVLTISGLTVGATYSFQWWSSTPGGSSPNATATAGNSVTLDPNVTDVNGGIGQFAIGTFIADNATQQVTYSLDSTVSALQLRQTAAAPVVTAVPEPGSALVGMLVLGVCGLGSARRRRS